MKAAPLARVRPLEKKLRLLRLLRQSFHNVRRSPRIKSLIATLRLDLWREYALCSLSVEVGALQSGQLGVNT